MKNFLLLFLIGMLSQLAFGQQESFGEFTYFEQIDGQKATNISMPYLDGCCFITVKLHSGYGFTMNLNKRDSLLQILDREEFAKSMKYMKTELGKYLNDENTKEKWVDLEILIGKFVTQKTSLKNSDFNSDFNILKAAIVNYLQRVQKETIKPKSVALNLIDKVKGDNNLIINFNYTNTLDNLFKQSNLAPEIIHIHGSIINKNIVVGVDDIAIIPEAFNTVLKKQFGYIGNPKIPTCFSNCRNLIIFGHSIGETDLSFFKKVFALEDLKNERLKEKRKITITHYGEDNCNRLKENISVILGIEGFRVFSDSGIEYFDVFNKSEFDMELNRKKGITGLQYL